MGEGVHLKSNSIDDLYKIWTSKTKKFIKGNLYNSVEDDYHGKGRKEKERNEGHDRARG